jgi:hypothetical protein
MWVWLLAVILASTVGHSIGLPSGSIIAANSNILKINLEYTVSFVTGLSRGLITVKQNDIEVKSLVSVSLEFYRGHVMVSCLNLME